MADTAPYRSTKSVPDRVDAAWKQGYDAGVSDSRKLVGIGLVVGTFIALRRHNVHPVATLVVATFVALYAIPVALVVWAAVAIIRAAVKAHRARPKPIDRVRTSDGEWF